MNAMVRLALRPMGSLVLLALILTGCRTYGGHGTEAETLDQMQQANRLFADALERARGELGVLERSTDPAVAAFAEPYAAVVSQHEAFVETHRALAAEAADARGSYRTLNRLYTTIISEQQIVADGYAEVRRDLRQAVTGVAEQAIPLRSRYQVAPQFYERIRYRLGPQTVTDILAAARPAPPPSDTTAALN